MMIKQIRTVCCTIVFLGLQLLACCHADLYFFGDSLSEGGNLPLLGQTPFFNSVPPASTALNSATTAFNSLLSAQLHSLRSQLHRIRIADVQISRLFQAVTRSPRLFGLRNVVDSATLFDPVSGLGYALAPNVDPSRYLFWDSIHPTTKGHKIIAVAGLLHRATKKLRTLLIAERA